MKKIINYSYFLLIAIGCKVQEPFVKPEITSPIVSVTANAQTNPVTSSKDAVGNSCIWVNTKNPLQTKIIGTNVKKGLEVYDLQGKRLYQYPFGAINNIEGAYFSLKQKQEYLIIGSNRTYNSITVTKVIQKTGELVLLSLDDFISKLRNISTVALYKNQQTDALYVFVTGISGGVEQWLLTENSGKLQAKIVREFSLPSKVTGMMVDSFNDHLYITQQRKGLWRYPAMAQDTLAPVKILKTTDVNMTPDLQGVTLYDSGVGEGYVLVSSQGNNTYAVLDRRTQQYIGSFSISDNPLIDGVTATEGISVTSEAIGEMYPRGFMVVQDSENTDAVEGTQNQNFKIIDWRAIAKALYLK